MAKQSWQRWIPVIAGAAVVIVVAVGLSLFVYHLMHNKPRSDSRQVAQTVNIIRPPPPPDTPPPPPPPPEEKIEQPVEQEPQQAPDQAPQEALGIDADASAGGDSFGLAARPGGRDLVGTGTAPFRWYTDKVAARIQECLSEDNRIRARSRNGGFSVNIEPDGTLKISRILASTGDKELDNAILNVRNCKVDAEKPVEMPRVVNIGFRSRG